VNTKKKSGGTAGSKEKKTSASREVFELVLSDPLLEDGFLSWNLGKVTTIGFTPGDLFLTCLPFQKL
jgi:hypothetical protein